MNIHIAPQHYLEPEEAEKWPIRTRAAAALGLAVLSLCAWGGFFFVVKALVWGI